MGGVRRRLIKPRTVLRNQCGRLSRVVTLTKVSLRRGKCRWEQLKRRAHRAGRCAHYHSVKNVQVLGCKRLSLIQENAREREFNWQSRRYSVGVDLLYWTWSRDRRAVSVQVKIWPGGGTLYYVYIHVSVYYISWTNASWRHPRLYTSEVSNELNSVSSSYMN
jgi:hypothetical protein